MNLPKSENEIDAWAKNYPDVAGIVETIASKKAKEASNDRLNKMLRPTKSIQRAARSASELSEAAVANFQMSTANRAARQGKKDAIEGMSSSFVNASF